MSKIGILLFMVYSCLFAGSVDNNSTKKKSSLKEKALFVNKKHYDEHLAKNAEQEKMKKKKELKIYKRKDGTIDTLKTINAANR
ncbi:hypothetical protein [Sulfuricurvum sp.]|uniref:hypothetical protein n=1 Tax=Sulfuricurvum sp. TaxID=2025608 RepID=UPI002E37D64F|nr:hypothetical protein [Sulfuricurvum sp.]HEX5329067.1 hypothetical protein [Sulfuricurvum sp.]